MCSVLGASTMDFHDEKFDWDEAVVRIEDVRAEAKARRSRRPSSGDPRQRNLDF
jgi:hypothetical protein